ncbi:YgiQ family radical SAM protein [Yersinia alsatica]|uniref:YgiQ family radical SAM protein n=1 Tax=Yersinia alsatica TaxID=2890317 RepID=A0ABY5UV41_9GAMM|nr:YgiQ family radical SAM protein [Yersinia alsatica]OWF69871.1 YgiQ family radical SAM protein [Yersinia frederiksenii]UWM46410.1 YgiQ family radical SAM protein [Yersinia alsatica]CFQ53858.1 putative Fe-S oxidoreductase family 2 [Yersinia frederiksenii]CND25442.1 putative Fe-S oxidoreductase family 2 [Yersinia frederiksenii]CNI19364.1 putative Fe-S oxidoreductase family 2 [Yersinia frederiksenii]
MSTSLIQPERDLFSYQPYWAECYGTAPFLPMSREEMDILGWDSCDIIVITGDAYVDHPSFGMAIVGRMLEAQGFRVGIIAQPDWTNKNDFMRLGEPNLFFGVTAGNMDSMINRYTADRKLRHDDAYTPDNQSGKRPDRATLVYSQRCKEAYSHVPVLLGGIEASLRRIAHYDYWSDTVRRSVIVDAKADMLVYGNGERPLVEVAHRLANGEKIADIQDVRNTVVMRKSALPGWSGVDSTRLDKPGRIEAIPNPYGDDLPCATDTVPEPEAKPVTVRAAKPKPWEKTYVLLPSYEKVKADKVLYAHTSRILHHETNPGCARALMQKHGDRYIWINPPAIPLSTEEMDSVFALPYQRVPHPAYGKSPIPAYDMIRFSINIMRGCYGGCSFCSITEHEGRIIQSRSEDSIIREIEEIRDKVPGFTGIISDLGGPTANMYMLRCQSPRAEQTCRRASCVYPEICPHMDTNHQPTISLYRRARDLKGIKKILIASGVRYDLAVEDPRYIKELASHHVGGYLKIAPEHTEEGPLSKMMKPGMGSYQRFKELFDTYSKQAGKEQYLIPYFISAHPGTEDKDMVNLALWLKKNRFRLDQVQNFYPSPLANSTTMYYTGKNPLGKVDYKSEDVVVPKGDRQRRLHKALLRYHDPANWPMIRAALEDMGLQHLIGSRRECLVPAPTLEEQREARRAFRQHTPALTKHTSITRQRQPTGRVAAKTPLAANSASAAKPSVKPTGTNHTGANKTGANKTGANKTGANRAPVNKPAGTARGKTKHH